MSADDIKCMKNYPAHKELNKTKVSDPSSLDTCFFREGLVSIETVKCSHPTVMKDMCADCGADLRL